ncbi:nitrogen regulation protein NR(II) [Geobacter sp.]|uniref:two-component system sensor histidine kinase NtrB n=1 Tax=Geobacter sp. TaxID=46610 RepID=UPI001AC11633|nr:ATP-binding protein [Geobacter sp.]CAG1065340.1 two-component system, NtrC family, sensor histidine kinase HydH [uncultured bacterium]
MTLTGPLRILLLAVFVVGISLFHYLTPLHLPALHDIFQRLYYLPIILAALWFGLRGGLAASVIVSILYAPHILFQWGASPSLELEKFLEILLYNVVGGVTGFLCQKEEERREELERTARRLEESYRTLRGQADLIIGIEEQLRRAERLSALGELSAMLAHEIRNPLGSIRGTAEILRDDFRPGHPKYEFLEILLKETDRLNRVVEDFLRLSRPIDGERKTCDLAAELRELVTLLGSDAAARGVRISLEVDEIPPVTGDREKLRQAFLNLLLNGIQATGAGGTVAVRGAVLPRRGDEPPFVELAFTDTGVGIPGESLGKIFTPFFTTKEGGTGLGLAITQRIVEGHGGIVTVESEPGQGTTFRVRLPV